MKKVVEWVNRLIPVGKVVWANRKAEVALLVALAGFVEQAIKAFS